MKHGLFLTLPLAFWFFALPASAQKKGWEEEWNRILAAGRKEGKVVIASSPDPLMRREVIPKFMSRFGIAVEFLAGQDNQIAGRVRTERQADVHTVDFFLGGIDTTANILYAEKMLDPLRPLLMLPEVVDPGKWKTGKPWFVEPEQKYILRPFSSVSGLLHINTEYVKPEEIRSARDLLDPRWRGKIAVEEPSAGKGASRAARFYREFGEEFVRKLYFEQKPARSRDRRQTADWLARGSHPICLGCRSEEVDGLRRDGFKLMEIFQLTDMPAEIGPAPWVLSVMNRRPHPNAAHIFANWIVSRESLEIYSRAGRPTLRRDVDESALPQEIIPRAGVTYFDVADWDWVASGRKDTRERVERILRLQ